MSGRGRKKGRDTFLAASRITGRRERERKEGKRSSYYYPLEGKRERGGERGG